ncbi:hypothetical protein HDZ31DRAFT_74050 [Schizophyllum fasciatum]
MSFLRAALSCCLGKRARDAQDDVIPNEESRLIPPVTDEPAGSSLPNVSSADQQRIRDKLGVIVRAKEGRMVNVHAAIPFNLHNQARPSDPSASRSASGSARRFPAAQRDSQLYASRESSLSSEGDAGWAGTEAGRGKPLGVRLVGGGAGGRARGRSRLKAGSSGGSSGEERGSCGEGRMGKGESTDEGTPTATAATVTEARPLPQAKGKPFKIEDPGDIALSWD